MNYVKKYKEALEIAQKLYQDCPNGKNDRLYHTTDLEKMFPELRESEDEKIRKELIEHCRNTRCVTEEGAEIIAKWIAWLEKQSKKNSVTTEEEEKVREQVVYAINKLNVPESEKNKLLAWLERQGSEPKPKFKIGEWIIYSNEEVHLITGFDDNGYFVDNEYYIPFNCEGNMRLWTIQDANELKKIEQKPTQEIEPFEAEHGKYYYCIKDYFCGGRKQASKGDVVQALRGLPIMGLKDASEYFLPVNSIKCNSTWSEDDEKMFNSFLHKVEICDLLTNKENVWIVNKLKSLKQRIGG